MINELINELINKNANELINKNANEIMKDACDLASTSIQIGGGPFGCIITDKNNNIIGKGHNTVTLSNDPTAHAEINAIRNTCKILNTFNLEEYVLYTSCEPCPMCLSAIYWSRIKTVYYGNTRTDAKDIGFDDEFIYNEINKDDKSIKLISCNSEYAKKSFNEWSNKNDKIEY